MLTPDVEALRAVYECGLAPLNRYRRPEMQATFGSWPQPPSEPAPAARETTTRRPLLRRWFGPG